MDVFTRMRHSDISLLLSTARPVANGPEYINMHLVDPEENGRRGANGVADAHICLSNGLH